MTGLGGRSETFVIFVATPCIWIFPQIPVFCLQIQVEAVGLSTIAASDPKVSSGRMGGVYA